MGLLEAMRQRVLLCDGAMGTQLQAAGLENGGCGELWNVDHPERVRAIQAAYVAAGSDCLITNTFGGSRIMLQRHGAPGRVTQINEAGAAVARAAFGARPGFVLGDIGPFGGLLEPFGEFSESDVRAAFAEQARALVRGGVDAIIIETQTALEELGIAIESALDAGATCVIGSVAFDVTRDGTDARTMMGVTAEQAAEFIQARGAHVAALNCGAGVDMKWAARLLARYRAACDLPLMAQPNAGVPALENMRVVYRETPDEMAAGAPAVLQAGARIVGGCCGTTPAHIARLRQALDHALPAGAAI